MLSTPTSPGLTATHEAWPKSGGADLLLRSATGSSSVDTLGGGYQAALLSGLVVTTMRGWILSGLAARGSPLSSARCMGSRSARLRDYFFDAAHGRGDQAMLRVCRGRLDLDAGDAMAILVDPGCLLRPWRSGGNTRWRPQPTLQDARNTGPDGRTRARSRSPGCARSAAHAVLTSATAAGQTCGHAYAALSSARSWVGGVVGARC